jgi:hypothetical protein
MAECIHGFEDGLCDSCFPRPAAAVPEKRTSTRRVVHGLSRNRIPGEAKQPEQKVVPLADRRIYHVTHVNNLESILIDGAIRAGVNPGVDMLSQLGRERRSEIEVMPSVPVTEFVPFSMSPDASWWHAVRTGAVDSQWSAAVRGASASEFVVLVGTAGAVGEELVLTDADAGEPLTRFSLGREAASIALRRMTLEDPELREPEVLARNEYPVAEIALIALPSEPARKRVKALLAEVGGHAPRLAVYPPWFVPAAAE